MNTATATTATIDTDSALRRAGRAAWAFMRHALEIMGRPYANGATPF